jgi:hypothetical protein
MILFAGAGSFVSDVLPATAAARLERWLPLIAAAAIAALTAVLQPITDSTIHLGLGPRIAIVVALIAPVSMLLGFFFPTGLRLVARLAPSATAWMWGVNGACGVLGSITAVGVSIWLGIQSNLIAAALLYALLLLPVAALRRAHESSRGVQSSE